MTLRLAPSLLWFLASTAGAAAPAVETRTSAPSAVKADDVAPDFRVGPGDVLAVDVWQEPSISGKFTIAADGIINHPLLGRVAVAGKTSEQIGQDLQAALRDGYVKNARVSIKVDEFRSFRVSVVGAVKQPGVLFLRGRADLFSVLLLAGGADAGVPGDVTVVRAQSGGAAPGILSANLAEYLRSGDTRQNLALEPGDLVFVRGATAGASIDPARAVTVVGEVKSPGVFELSGNDTVLSIVLRAGGPTEYAARNGTRVYRAGGARPVDVKLADILDHGERKKDLGLKAGDLVVVPARLF